MRFVGFFAAVLLVAASVAAFIFIRNANAPFVAPRTSELARCFGVSPKNLSFSFKDDPLSFEGYQRVFKNEITGRDEVFVKSLTTYENSSVRIFLYVNREMIIDPNISGYERSISAFLKEEFVAGSIKGYDVANCSDRLVQMSL